jgi:two-component system response regulator YesN
MTDGTARSQRILVVDDEPALLDAIKIAFERAGHEVVACRSFEDARARVLSERFDAIVTDVRLGAFNGLQLGVIARDKDPSLGIIVFSGYDDPVLRAQALDLGAIYLVKPVTGERLIEELGKIADARDGKSEEL